MDDNTQVLIVTDGDNWRHVLWGQSDAPDASGGSILSDGTVWLRAATPEHEGWYRCTARVQHSFLHHSFYLDVRGESCKIFLRVSFQNLISMKIFSETWRVQNIFENGKRTKC